MINKLCKGALAMAFAFALAWGQAKQPKPKSQKEVDALVAIQNAATPEARITAIEDLLTKFADTEFKGMALQMAAASAQQAGNWEKMVVYAERTLESDPKNYPSMLMLADYYATRTREFDLDKEEKLTRSDKYAKDALENLKAAEKPNPAITDDQWAAAKKDYASQAHAALAAAAALRKKYDIAVAEYKTAVDGLGTPNAEMLVRAAAAYTDAGKYDDAISLLDRALTLPDVHPTTKQVAQSEKSRAQKMKTSGAKPGTGPGATPQVEIKK